MTKTKKDAKDYSSNKPWVSNYPPLQAWLEKHEARCMWQIPLNERPRGAPSDWVPQAYVECHLIGRKLALVVVHANKHGWDIYTGADTSRITETLADAERRLGLLPPLEPSQLLDEHAIDCCQRIGRDEEGRRTTIGLNEMDALCATARVGARASAKAREILARPTDYDGNDAEELVKLVLGLE